MDSSLPAAEVAARLGVPDSRVVTWCRRGTVAAVRDSRGRWRLDVDEAERLVAEHGAVPEPHPEGWSRADLLVLAALSRAPRGLPSARAVAARTALATTTAATTLARLEQAGLAKQVREPRLWRGRAVDHLVWYGDVLDAAYERLLPYLHRVELPSPPRPARRGRLPDHLWHLIWNADPLDVDVERDATYLVHRAMTTGDPEAIAWAVTALPADAFQRAVHLRGVSPEVAAWIRASQSDERVAA